MNSFIINNRINFFRIRTSVVGILLNVKVITVYKRFCDLKNICSAKQTSLKVLQSKASDLTGAHLAYTFEFQVKIVKKWFLCLQKSFLHQNFQAPAPILYTVGIFLFYLFEAKFILFSLLC